MFINQKQIYLKQYNKIVLNEMSLLSEQGESCEVNVPVDKAFADAIDKAKKEGDPDFTGATGTSKVKPKSFLDALSILDVKLTDEEEDDTQLTTIQQYLNAIKAIKTEEPEKLNKLLDGFNALLSGKEKTPEEQASTTVNGIWREMRTTTGKEVKQEFFKMLVDLYKQRKKMKKGGDHPEKDIAIALRKSGLIHNSTIRDHLTNGEFDMEKFAKTISKPPIEILKKNEKMSKTKDMMVFDTTMPAYEGLYYSIKNKKFFLKRTCPGAGDCTFQCFARKGNAAVQPEISLNRTRTLTFYMNDPQGFKEKIIREIEQKKQQHKGVQVAVRWHESGDFWDERYLVFAFSIAEEIPDVKHYAYTKQVSLINKYKDKMPANFMFNFSFGGKEDQKLSINIDKNAVILPKETDDGEPIFKGLPVKLLDDGKTEDYINKFFNSKKSVAEKDKAEIIQRIIKTRQLLNRPEGMQKAEWNKIVKENIKDFTVSLNYNDNKWDNVIAIFLKRTFTDDAIKILKERALDYLTKKHNLNATIEQIITFDEMLGIHGAKKVQEKTEPYYHVLVWGVHGDNAATRKDVISSILLFH